MPCRGRRAPYKSESQCGSDRRRASAVGPCERTWSSTILKIRCHPKFVWLAATHRLALGPDLSGASPKEPAALRARHGQRALRPLSDVDVLAPGEQLSQLFLSDYGRGRGRKRGAQGKRKGLRDCLKKRGGSLSDFALFLVPRSSLPSGFSRFLSCMLGAARART